MMHIGMLQHHHCMDSGRTLIITACICNTTFRFMNLLISKPLSALRAQGIVLPVLIPMHSFVHKQATQTSLLA